MNSKVHNNCTGHLEISGRNEGLILSIYFDHKDNCYYAKHLVCLGKTIDDAQKIIKTIAPLADAAQIERDSKQNE